MDWSHTNWDGRYKDEYNIYKYFLICIEFHNSMCKSWKTRANKVSWNTANNQKHAVK